MGTDKLNELRDFYDKNEVPLEPEAGRWEAEDATPTSERMSGFSFRLPAEVLERARALGAEQGLSTGEWIRRTVEAAVVSAEAGSSSRVVDVNELLAFLAERGQAA